MNQAFRSILNLKNFPYNYLLWLLFSFFVEAVRFKSTYEVYYHDNLTPGDLLSFRLSPPVLAILCMVILPLLVLIDRVWLVKFLYKKPHAKKYFLLGLCISGWFSYHIISKAGEYTIAMNGFVFILPIITLTLSVFYNLILGQKKLSLD